MFRTHLICVLIGCLLCLPLASLAKEHDGKKLPKVQTTVLPLDLSRPPTTEEVMAAGQLGGPLHPTHDLEEQERHERVNLNFGQAIQEWNKHEYRTAVKMFRKHLEEYPDSPWAAEAVLHIGCDATYNGRYVEAEESFQSIIGKHKDSDHEGARRLYHKATLRMANLKTFQNNFEDAKRLYGNIIKTSDDWRDRTYASHWIQRLSRDGAHKVAMLNCGILALARALDRHGKAQEAQEVRETKPMSLSGQSLQDLTVMASAYGFDLTPVRLKSAELMTTPLPAIVQLGARNGGDSGHYWVLEKVEDGSLDFFDPQAGRHFIQTAQEFMPQWDGVALVFGTQGSVVAGTKLSEVEAREVFGGCCGVPRAPSDLGQPSGNANGPSSSNDNSSSCGFPRWSVNMISMNLFMTDTPLWYAPPIGPPVQLTLSYNSLSSIVQKEPFGNKWQFSYGSYPVVDTGGQVTIFMPDGSSQIFTPNSSGGYTSPAGVFNTLTKSGSSFSLTLPDGTVYVYSVPPCVLYYTLKICSQQQFLTSITDRFGKKITFQYAHLLNKGSFLSSITDAIGQKTTITYDTNSRVTKVTDPFGRVASFNYDSSGNLIKITDMGGYSAEMTYDSTAYLKTLKDSRGSWQFYLEPADGIGNGSNPYPAPGSAMWENYRLTVTNPQGGQEEYYYNGYSSLGYYISPRFYIPYSASSNNHTNPNKITYDYSSAGGKGHVSSIQHYGNGGAETFAYDNAGLITSYTDVHGHVTRYTYNTQGRPLTITDPKNKVTTITYDTNGFDPKTITDGLGTITLQYFMKSLPRTIAAVIITPSPSVSTRNLKSITDRLGKTRTFTWNDYGQLLTETDPSNLTTTYIYAAAGQPDQYRLKEIRRDSKLLGAYGYDNKGRPAVETDATGLTLSTAYDDLDRVKSVLYPDGKQDVYQYSGCCPRLIDSITTRNGDVTNYTYDELKRLTTVKQPDGTQIKYGYDADGNMISLTDAKGVSTRFEYNPAGQVAKRIWPDAKTITYEYTKDLLTKRTSARNITTTYTYDVFDNLAGVSYSDGTPGVTFTNDDYGRLITRTDASGTTGYGYDANSRLTSLDGPWTDDTVTFSYDSAGRRIGVQPQGSETLTYGYDLVGRLTSIGVGTRQFTYAYPTTASPLPLSLTRPNGSVTGYHLDSLNRLTGITTRKSDSQVVLADSFTYNAQDQRSTETITSGPIPPALTDSLVTYDYNNLNQLLASSPNRTYSYDADGNLTGGYTPDGSRFTAAYDGENRLKTFDYTDSGSAAHHYVYTYAGNNFLAKQVVDGVETRFVRNGYTLLQERDSTNAVTRALAWDPLAPGGIGGMLELSQGGQKYYPYFDGKGNVMGILDTGQNIAAAYTYDPSGLLLAKSGTVNQPYLCSTKPYIEKTGLTYYGYRFYAPTIGKWMNRDPLYKLWDVNLYEYVYGNPITIVDYYGLLSENGGLLYSKNDYNTGRELIKDYLIANEQMSPEEATIKATDIMNEMTLSEASKMRKLANNKNLEELEKLGKEIDKRTSNKKEKQCKIK